MENKKSKMLFLIFLGICLIIFVGWIFRQGIFYFNNLQNGIYSAIFILFYFFAFIIPFFILYFSNQIKEQTKSLDFIVNSGNENNVFSKIYNSYKKTFISDENILGLSEKTRTNADLYFNSDDLCEAKFSFPIFPLMKIIVGAFTGIGILGTFIGFSAAIPNVTISSTEELNPLFSGLHTAFNTSIVGVFSSIIYNFFIVQPLIKVLNQYSKNLSDKLDELYFVNDVDAMEKLAHIVNGTLDTVQKNTKDLAEKFKNSSEEIFKEVISEGRDALNKEMTETALKLSEIARIFEQTPEAISKLNEELDSSIKNASKQTKIQLEAVVETIDKNLNEKFENFANELKPASENIKVSAEKIRETSGLLQNLPEKINEIHSSFLQSENALISNIQDISSSLRDSISAMGTSYDTILEAINKTLSKIQKTKEEIDSVLESSKLNNEEISKNLRGAIEQYNSLKNETDNMLSGYLKVDQSLKNIFEQIQNQFAAYSENIGKNLTKYIDGFSEGTKDYTAGFTTSVEEMKAAFEDMQQMLDALKQSEEKLALLPEKFESILTSKIESAVNQIKSGDEK